MLLTVLVFLIRLRNRLAGLPMPHPNPRRIPLSYPPLGEPTDAEVDARFAQLVRTGALR